MSPRAYEQRLRASSAAATRTRILDALYDRIRTEPAKPVSVDEIAQLAGVARSTIYTVFGSRPGLFDAAAMELIERGGFQRLVEATDLPDVRQALREAITAGVEIFSVDPDVFRALHAMEKLDADAVGGAIARIEARRSAGMTRMARRLKRAGELRDGMSVAHAAHVIWIAASFEAFDLLHSGRGLPADQIAEILVDGVERTICRP